jgi:hypothetical protein
MDDITYFHQRAEAELKMAEKSVAPQAVKAHYELAGHYLDRVFGKRSNITSRS